MGLFSRKSKTAEVETSGMPSKPEVSHGPYDSSQNIDQVELMDLGALLVPALPGMELSVELASDKTTVRRVRCTMGTSTLSLVPLAAPKSGGLWDEVREEIIASVTQEKGSAVLVEERYGKELLVKTPVSASKGRRGTTTLRVLGIEGRCWLLRADITGPAAVDPAAAKQIHDLLDNLMVHRDSHPRPPRESLPLTVPSIKKIAEENEAEGAE